MRDYLHNVLLQDGYRCESFSDGLELLSYLGEAGNDRDLLLSDINMPGLNGIDLLRTTQAVEPDLPVILISGLYELGLALDALNAGAADYLLKPALPRDVLDLVEKHLRPVDDSQQSVAQQELRRFLSYRQTGRDDAEPLDALYQVLGFKRYETLQHCKRVAGYADLIGRTRGLPESELSRLQTGSLLHDIGKVHTTGHAVRFALRPHKLCLGPDRARCTVAGAPGRRGGFHVAESMCPCRGGQ
jgi:response regulator RpfG family c-di-GMP phosphodiesterase